jgi:hypothetical protein
LLDSTSQEQIKNNTAHPVNGWGVIRHRPATSLRPRALPVNNRIEVRMSVLQTAVQHAREPDQLATDLTVNGRTAGIAPAAFAALFALAPALALPQKSCKRLLI